MKGFLTISGALFASALLYRLSVLANSEEEAELARDMQLHSVECEHWAVGILSECYNRDKRLTHSLLIRILPIWGDSTLFKLAESFEMMDFVEHSACQTKLSSIWKGHMTMYTSELKIALCAICPLLLPFIKFNVDRTHKPFDGVDVDDLPEFGAKSTQVDERVSAKHINQVGPRVLPDEDRDGKGFVRSKTRRNVQVLASRFKQVYLFDFTANFGILMAIYYFYQAPVTKLFGNIFGYIAFCSLFAYVVLTKLRPVYHPDSPSVEEYIIWLWCFTMIIEEIRQLFMRDHHSLKYKFRSWYGNIWNRFDAVMYTCFVLSILLRLVLPTDRFHWARISYSITLNMFMLRFMQYFYAEKNMGPKVIMIRRMLTDLMFFFLILLVFMVSFGVAYHANMFPDASANWSVLVNVLYFTYFQMYGELFLDDLKGDESTGCTTNETIWREDPYKRCAKDVFIVPILLAIYMILTNILLVNLLIAMFSYTFQTVQDNSTKVWRFYRLSLVSEYSDRPSLVPPIIIINHLLRIVRFALNRIVGARQSRNSFRWVPMDDERKRLTLFEKSSTETFLAKSRLEMKLTLDSRVKNTSKRLDLVIEELQKIKDTMQVYDAAKVTQPVTSSSFITPMKSITHVAELGGPESHSSKSEGHSMSSGKQPSQALADIVSTLVNQNEVLTERISGLTGLLESSMSRATEIVHKSEPVPDEPR